MQLTQHTDFALRTLIALSVNAPEKMTTQELADAYSISVHHLNKVVQHLSALGYVETIRGKNGGIRLAQSPESIRVGDVVRQTEAELGVVACLRQGGEECTIDGACRLKRALARATEQFIGGLNEHTLADIAKPRTKLIQLLALEA